LQSFSHSITQTIANFKFKNVIIQPQKIIQKSIIISTTTFPNSFHSIFKKKFPKIPICPRINFIQKKKKKIAKHNFFPNFSKFKFPIFQPKKNQFFHFQSQLNQKKCFNPSQHPKNQNSNSKTENFHNSKHNSIQVKTKSKKIDSHQNNANQSFNISRSPNPNSIHNSTTLHLSKPTPPSTHSTQIEFHLSQFKHHTPTQKFPQNPTKHQKFHHFSISQQHPSQFSKNQPKFPNKKLPNSSHTINRKNFKIPTRHFIQLNFPPNPQVSIKQFTNFPPNSQIRIHSTSTKPQIFISTIHVSLPFKISHQPPQTIKNSHNPPVKSRIHQRILSRISFQIGFHFNFPKFKILQKTKKNSATKFIFTSKIPKFPKIFHPKNSSNCHPFPNKTKNFHKFPKIPKTQFPPFPQNHTPIQIHFNIPISHPTHPIQFSSSKKQKFKNVYRNSHQKFFISNSLQPKQFPNTKFQFPISTKTII